MIFTNIATWAPLAAGVALLFRSSAAVWLFGVSLAFIVVTNIYGFASGTSQALANQGALIVTIIIFVLAVLQLLYSGAMKKRGVLA